MTTGKCVKMLGVTAIVVLDRETDLQQMEMDVISGINASHGVYHTQVLEVNISPLADRAFCCPVCGGDIEVETSITGIHRSKLDLAQGTPTHGSFEGDQDTTYFCSSNSSHDVGEVVALLNTMADTFLETS